MSGESLRIMVGIAGGRVMLEADHEPELPRTGDDRLDPALHASLATRDDLRCCAIYNVLSICYLGIPTHPETFPNSN